MTSRKPCFGEGERPSCFLALIWTVLFATLAGAGATVTVTPPLGSSMVLQRGEAVPVSGTATANTEVTVTFNGQTKVTNADGAGKWQVTLDPMVAKASGGNLTATEAGANTVTLSNVVVGDVWICSGQSNMDMILGSCDRQVDIDSANYPVMRQFRAPLVQSGVPLETVTGTWTVCSPSTAAGFSAVAFYFGRKICDEQGSAIPIGLYLASVGGTTIDPWLAPEGATDIPVLDPLYSMPIMPSGPFRLFNGMVFPHAPLPAKGMIWYQGENAQSTTESPDSYYLKMKALAQGYQRMLGMEDFAFYFVQLAYWGDQQTSPAPVLFSGGWDADTRIQQARAMALPHSGMASAMDVGSSLDGEQIWDGWHPKNKLDVGERLALWALKNDYGMPIAETSGPILRDVTISGSTLVCSFDHIGEGLMVGSKEWYMPTTEVVGGTLDKFSIAGTTGGWHDATATIVGDTVVVSSPSVPNPRKVAYACWQNPVGANLYNKVTLDGVADGLPASPFYIDDVTAKHSVTASAGTGGSISPAGTTTFLERATALYTITPDAGQFIQDVMVDGVSVGAVEHYTFDPLYADHTIAVTFGPSAPSFTVNASASGGGTITPSGAVTVAQGGTRTFTVDTSSGAIVTLSVDGKSLGPRTRHTFANVRENHTIDATFTFPITAQAGYGGTITPAGTTVVTYGSDQTYTITPNAGFSISKVTVDGVNVGTGGTHTFSNVTASHAITATFTGAGGSGSIPQQDDIILSCLTDTLPASGGIASWPMDVPAGQSLSVIGSPTVNSIDGRKFVHNSAVDYDGFRFGGAYSSPIPCTGASIVVVAKPTRFGGADNNWQSIVDVFYDELVLGIMNGSGKICVRSNGSLDYSTSVIPEGQMTILSLVVQPDGSYKVYANGVEAMSRAGNGAWTELGHDPFAGHNSYINIGRNNPDAWTTFNGDIGDVFLYKTALTDPERVELETYLVNRLTYSGPTHTITASAGAGGSISPAGAVIVNEGADQSFTITPEEGFVISDVLVDGGSIGAAATHTFNGVSERHTITASFASTGNTPPSVSAIPDQEITTDTSTAVLAFTVGDSQTPAGDLVVTASSSNTGVVPHAGVVLGGSGANRTVQVTPDAGETGTSTITLTVTDGDSDTAETSFVVSVKQPATVTLNDLIHVHDGTPKSAGYATDPAGLSVTLTYDGSPTPPTGTGSYEVVATVVDPVYHGSASGTMTIASAGGSGGVISVTFNANRTLVPTDETGSVVTAGNWNNIPVTGGAHNGSWASLKDSDGIPTTASITTAGWSGYLSMSTDGSLFTKLYEGGLMIQGDVPAADATITLSGIPYAMYDVYLYYTHFPIGSDTLQAWTESGAGTTLYGVNNKNHGHDWGGFTPYQTADRSMAVAQALTDGADGGGNWLRFEGLTSANLTLTSSDENLPEVTVNGLGGSFVQRGLAGLQVVELGGGDAYANWITGFAGLGGQTGFADDPDGDGIGNGMESYLGTEPGVPNAGLTAIAVAGSSFTFTHSESNEIPSDVSAGYEWSPDLENWFGNGLGNGEGVTVTISEDSRIDNSAPDHDVVTAVAIATGDAPSLFVRLRATLQTS